MQEPVRTPAQSYAKPVVKPQPAKATQPPPPPDAPWEDGVPRVADKLPAPKVETPFFASKPPAQTNEMLDERMAVAKPLPTLPEAAHVGFFAYLRPDGFVVNHTVRAMTAELFNLALEAAISAVTASGGVPFVSYENRASQTAPATFIRPSGSSLVVAPAKPTGTPPAPAATSGTSRTEFVAGENTVKVERLSVEMTNKGDRILKVFFKPFLKFGATCWGETASQYVDFEAVPLGTDLQIRPDMARAVVVFEEGKPKRVVSFHAQ